MLYWGDKIKADDMGVTCSTMHIFKGRVHSKASERRWDWSRLAQDGVQWWAFVDRIINLRVP